MMEGCKTRAMPKSARTSFSPSPTHFDVIDEAAILKKVALHCEAMHRPKTLNLYYFFYNSKMKKKCVKITN